ncbi:MBL fold metallo-hydrolase [Alteribacillus iranensis]|uniref:RNA processing exonuclease, beta-lactamase fold, Cft2 family n=1 Tax=Alteribacillus iranensis TaxID=930128 RepID=A0A1I2DI83_9BACI|nr:MBL fold metallo-hydrolase [Alteribacillus iranensis]SFE80177.1 RNA processing exonuclease, beta-lactamase fold, Cft2 family [Alteribacillus iranensis]
MKIKFLGGAGESNRSCFLLETDQARILIDCGINKEADTEFYQYPLDLKEIAADIDAVFLTHCHIDHCGAIPYLIEHGFQGLIYTSSPTKCLVPSFWLEWENTLKKELSHSITEYDKKVEWVELPMNSHSTWHDLPHLNLSFQYGRAGHTLGSLWFMFSAVNRTVFFSGDYQVASPQLTFDYPQAECVDVAVMDGAYGRRLRDPFLFVKLGMDALTTGRKLGIITQPHGKGLSMLVELEKKSVFAGRDIYLSPAYKEAMSQYLNEGEWWKKEVQNVGELLWKRHVSQWEDTPIIAATEKEFVEMKRMYDAQLTRRILFLPFYPVHPFYEETLSVVEHLQPSLTCVVHANRKISRSLVRQMERDNQRAIAPVAGDQVEVVSKQVNNNYK